MRRSRHRNRLSGGEIVGVVLAAASGTAFVSSVVVAFGWHFGVVAAALMAVAGVWVWARAA